MAAGLKQASLRNIRGDSVSGVSAFKEEVVFAGAMAIIAAALASLGTFLNPAEKKATHHNAGTKFNALRSKARRLKNIDLESDDAIDKLRMRVEELSEERDSLNETSPQIPKRAFKKARRGIEEGEASYTADKGRQ